MKKKVFLILLSNPSKSPNLYRRIWSSFKRFLAEPFTPRQLIRLKAFYDKRQLQHITCNETNNLNPTKKGK